MWHDPGSISFSKWVEPGEPWENVATKRRIHSLLCVSGAINELESLAPRAATKEEITRFHTSAYHDRIVSESKRDGGGDGGELARFAQGGYEIAALSAGGILTAIEAIHAGKIRNAYCLVRPPGHHAIKDKGMGFCIFNNIALGALHAKTLGMKRVAIVDYDVHHGNGTQDAFWNDPDVLFVSLHQDNNYPIQTGSLAEIGGPDATGSTINLPMPPGSGTGAYDYAFDTVVIPALLRFKPDIILVSSGFDASDADPLGSMMLSSEAFGSFAKKMSDAAVSLGHGRLLFAHEGGYSKDYVPFCALAVIEAISGLKTEVSDPYLEEIRNRGYQSCQPHQKALVDAAAALHGLATVGGGTAAGATSLSKFESNLAYAISHLLSTVPDSERRKAILSSIVSSS
jgi:acetoin utilization deacetylase AcuC-like enzyme